MFSAPSIPTDSFYKFSFVGGIVLIIFAWFLLYEESKLITQLSTTKYNLDDRKLLNDDLLKRNLADKEALIERVKIKEGKNAIKSDIEGIRLNRYIVYLALSIGSGFVLFGGIFWYLMSQLPQDRLLKIQLQTAEINLAKLKKENP